MGQSFGILGSCALAWAVKEVPDSEDGPPDAELPRQTDIDPFAQGEARKVRAGSLSPQRHVGGVRLHFSPIRRRVGSMVDRSSSETRGQAKRLPRWEHRSGDCHKQSASQCHAKLRRHKIARRKYAQTDRIRNCGATNSEENEGYGSHKATGFRRCGGDTVGQCGGPLSRRPQAVKRRLDSP